MQKKQAAVIDISSSKITAVVGERGMNKTFVIKARNSYDYDGFAEGVFFDEQKLKGILLDAVTKLAMIFHGKLETIYVSVPGEFTSLTVKSSQISFPKKKRIDENDIDSLFDGAFVVGSSKSTLINRSAVMYELDDFRKLANPINSYSEILKGKLSFIVASDYFMQKVVATIKSCGNYNVECVSASLARALYLLDAESRDRIAVILDVGYIASTLSVIQGDGIIFEKSFDYGGGYITAALSEKFSLDFYVADEIKRKVNIFSLAVSQNDYIEAENGNYLPMEEIRNTVLSSLDALCEKVADAFEEFGFAIPEYVPLNLTGGGISLIRGAKEHLSSRLEMPVTVLSPSVPMMDKPTESTLLSLLNIALEQ
ncbi:MAG: hypothetical protein SPL13_00170 [Clostridia bacterium]|nr:hypothetical protein [Clostridia bacterium]